MSVVDFPQISGGPSRLLRSQSLSQGNQKAPLEDVPSLLLSRSENELIFSLLPPGCMTLATAVVQLLHPTRDQKGWERKETGIACVVRDGPQKSYFIHVISMKTLNFVFSQEIYSQFTFTMVHKCFLTFEGDDSMVGLNFADYFEACKFNQTLQDNLEKRRTRFEHRKWETISRASRQRFVRHVDSPGAKSASKLRQIPWLQTSSSNNEVPAGQDKGYDMFRKRFEQTG